MGNGQGVLATCAVYTPGDGYEDEMMEFMGLVLLRAGVCYHVL